MTQIIRTKLHKVLPLVDAGQVVTTSPPGALSQYADREEIGMSFQYDEFTAFFKTMAEVPTFIVDPELLALAKQSDCHKSMIDMQKADMLHLPFPCMWVEIPGVEPQQVDLPDRRRNFTLGAPSHACVLLWERGLGHPLLPEPKPEAPELSDSIRFGAFIIQLHKDASGEYIAIAPAFNFLGIDSVDDQPMVGMAAYGCPWFKGNTPALNELVKATFRKSAASCWSGLFTALLLMQTRGVEREVVDVPAKLNKKRVANGKLAISRHTYIHIGRVYRTADSDVTDEYVPRRSPIPHWRRGHNRGVRYGVGRANVKNHWFPPMLVARYEGGDDEPPAPKYKVKQ